MQHLVENDIGNKTSFFEINVNEESYYDIPQLAEGELSDMALSGLYQ